MTLLLYSCKQKNTLTSIKTHTITRELSENTSTYIYEIISNDTSVMNYGQQSLLQINKYIKEENGPKQLIYKEHINSPNSSFIFPIKESIEITDLDDDHKEEIHLIYTIFDDKKNNIECKLISIINNTYLLTSINDDGKIQHSEIKKVANSFKQFASNKLNNHFIRIKSNLSFNKNEFNNFTELFKPTDSEIIIQERYISQLKTNPISQQSAEKFICNVLGSTLACEVSPAISETIEGIDIRNDFETFGKIESEKYILLLYKQSIPNYPRMILAIHQYNGKLISRIIFAGNLSDAESIDGEIQKDKIIITKKIYKYGHKGDMDFFLQEQIKELGINKHGIIMEGEMLISDQLI